MLLLASGETSRETSGVTSGESTAGAATADAASEALTPRFRELSSGVGSAAMPPVRPIAAPADDLSSSPASTETTPCCAPSGGRIRGSAGDGVTSGSPPVSVSGTMDHSTMPVRTTSTTTSRPPAHGFWETGRFREAGLTPTPDRAAGEPPSRGARRGARRGTRSGACSRRTSPPTLASADRAGQFWRSMTSSQGRGRRALSSRMATTCRSDCRSATSHSCRRAAARADHQRRVRGDRNRFGTQPQRLSRPLEQVRQQNDTMPVFGNAE